MIPGKEEIFHSLPVEFQTDQVLDDLVSIYDRAVGMMCQYAKDVKNVELRLSLFQETGGHQLIATGEVLDLDKKIGDSYNWHLQNTSQWVFAFGLVFDIRDSKFSMHT